jgi:oleandomycin transport system permease protein
MSVTAEPATGPAAGAARRPHRRRFPRARHSLVLARRNLIGIVRTPEALIDVTLQPIIFIAMFT